MEIHANNYYLQTSFSQLSAKSTPPSILEKIDDDQQKSNTTISTSQNTTQAQTEKSNNKNDVETKSATNNAQLLDESELKQVEELKQRDAEVRAHEAAHLAAAGKYATGGASFEYTRGPDGKSYATSGEVRIDTSPIPNDPEATLQKAQQIQTAAQAPTQPSSQDRQVAAEASVMASEARAEIMQRKSESDSEKTSENAKNEYQYIEGIISEEQSQIPTTIDQIA